MGGTKRETLFFRVSPLGCGKGHLRTRQELNGGVLIVGGIESFAGIGDCAILK